MCNLCVYPVQFPGCIPADLVTSINGINFPANWTVDDLISQNPQFFYAFGDTGINTLCTCMTTEGVDLTLTYIHSNVSHTVTAKPIAAHPIHAPH